MSLYQDMVAHRRDVARRRMYVYRAAKAAGLSSRHTKALVKGIDCYSPRVAPDALWEMYMAFTALAHADTSAIPDDDYGRRARQEARAGAEDFRLAWLEASAAKVERRVIATGARLRIVSY